MLMVACSPCVLPTAIQLTITEQRRAQNISADAHVGSQKEQQMHFGVRM